MNIGLAAASILMINAGYKGDIAVSAVGMGGGFGMTTQQAVYKILNPFIVHYTEAEVFSTRIC